MEQEVVTVGLDLAKNVFQGHAIAADGGVLIRRLSSKTTDVATATMFELACSGHDQLNRRVCAGFRAPVGPNGHSGNPSLY